MSRISAADFSATQPESASSANSLTELDLDQFLQLMIAELENQDPLDPLDNSELLQQISQIREVGATDKLTETLESVLTGQNLSNASSLIGKQIQALDDASEEVDGVVDRVSLGEGEVNQREIKIHVGDKEISLQNIRSIQTPEA